MGASTLVEAQAAKVDSAIPGYQKTSGVSGNLNSVGSDTLNNLMTLWAEGFQKQYPNVRIQIEGKGSSTAPPALISGTAQIGPMSREMKSSEIDEFEKKYGYKPTPVRVAVDALAVYVNKDNPLEKLTMQEVDAIFSKTRACGSKQNVTTWAQAGLKDGAWGSRPMSLYGRNSASGTYGYFKEHALCKGDYKDQVKEQPGSASVVQGVTADISGIGYSGIGYKTSGVKALALAAKPGAPYYPATPEDALSGKYPLSRFLYVYVNKAPNKPLDPLVREFIKYVLSQQGQEVVVKDGYIPMPNRIVSEETAKISK
ncbi:MAG TPA: phosphate ABC transporter substrate-binding protein [Thermoanaerobaculia bacterium]|nr:phosphate ABC transporter substrate-binding protein [Thermoanaerobaculia bacterium]